MDSAVFYDALLGEFFLLFVEEIIQSSIAGSLLPFQVLDILTDVLFLFLLLLL